MVPDALWEDITASLYMPAIATLRLWLLFIPVCLRMCMFMISCKLEVRAMLGPYKRRLMCIFALPVMYYLNGLYIYRQQKATQVPG